MSGAVARRISRAVHWIRDVLDSVPEEEILKRCSFSEFRANGAEVVNGLGIEPDAYSVAKILLEAILAQGQVVDLEVSTVIWQDLSSTVSVPKGQRFTPTQVGFEVIDHTAYYLVYAAYPPAIEIGTLIPSETGPSRRYRKLELVNHSRTDITHSELHDLASRALSAKPRASESRR